MRNNRRLSFDLRRIANQSPSEEVFFERISSKKPDDMSRQVFNEEVGKPIFERKQKFFDSVFGDRANTVMASQDLAVAELYDSVDAETGEETQVLPDGTVYRDPETGNLHTETRKENGRTRVYAGDRNTGAVYGFAEISTDGDTLTVDSVRVRPGYENIRAELVQKAISEQRTGESNIEWNPETEGLHSVRELLIQNNPRGREAGLDYGADFSFDQDHDIQQIAAEVNKAIPNLTKAQSVVAARIYSIADAAGTLSKLNGGQPVRKTDNLAERYRGAANAAKAIIYAGQNADFSTFYHELFHVNAANRPHEARQLSNAIRNAIQDEASKANLLKFIEESSPIWGAGSNAAEVMKSLASIAADSDASQWTREQFENLARLAEAYATADNSKRTTLPEAIRNIIRKIAEFMRQVYQTVTHTVPLPKEITDAYDAIMYKSTRDGFANTDQDSQSNRISFQSAPSKNSRKEIHDLAPDSDTRNKRITFSEHTPDIFQQFGFNDNPVVMSAGKLKQGLFGNASEKSGHSDSLTADIVEQVLDRFADPYYIFSSTHGTDLVAIYDILDKQGNPVLVSLRANQREGRNELNFITSIYGKKGNSIQDWIRAGLLLYRNDTKKLTGAFAARLQLPRGVTPATMNNVRRKSEYVNQGLVFQGGEQYQATDERLRSDSSNFDAEGHHLAPNGKPSNLSYEQWVTVRTPAFKEWFGDWEHTYRINKWLSNENILSIDSNAYSGLYELNWRSAKRYALDNLRGQYKVDDNGAVIELTRDGVSEIISENMGSELGLKLVAYIPDIIKNSIFVYAEANQKTKNSFDYFEYYLTDIDVDGNNYVVKSAVGVRDGRRYYTFNLSEIKDKGAFVNSRPVSDIQPGQPTSQGSLSDIKDTRLLSILQADSSKVVDENGEPLVVYHGTNNRAQKRVGRYPDGTWKYDYSEFSVFKGANFFNSDEDNAGGYGSTVYPVFLNLRSPLIIDADGQNYSYIRFNDEVHDTYEWSDYAKSNGYDGVIFNGLYDGVDYGALQEKTNDYVTFNSNQIKSVDNRGTFDSENPDIYFQDSNTPDTSDLTPEQNEKRNEAEEIDSSFTNNKAVDLEGFYDDFENIETLEDAERVAMANSVHGNHVDTASLDIIDSLADENIPDYDPERLNLKSDGSVAESLADYENDVAENVIPSRMNENIDSELLFQNDELEVGNHSIMIPDTSSVELLDALQSNSENYVPVELTKDKWVELFGAEQTVDVPVVGKVKISENQYLKLLAKGRGDTAGMLKPTLERPSLIIEEPAGSDNGANAYEFVKVFQTEDGKRWYYIAAVDKSGTIVATSSRVSYYNQIKNRLKKFPVAYVAADNQQAVDIVQRLRDAAGLNTNVSADSVAVNNDSENVRLIEGVSDDSMTFEEFVQRNKPDGVVFGEGSEEQKDDIFIRAIQDDENLERYLGIIGETLFLNTDRVNTSLFPDQKYRERKKDRVFDVITSRPVRNASAQVISGNGIVEHSLLRKVRKEMSANARFYRNQLAYLMNDDSMLPKTLIKESKGLLLPQREELDTLSAGNLRKLAVTAEDLELVDKVQKGTLKADQTADKARLEEINAALDKLSNSVERLQKEVDMAHGETDAVRARAKRQLADARKKQKDLQKQKRLLEEIREKKQRDADSIMHPVNLHTTDYSVAEPIWAIQSILDPHFRRDWVYDLEYNPEGETGGPTMTIEEAREYLKGLEKNQANNILSTLSPAIVDRLLERKKSLNDISLAELTSMKERVDLLRQQGREILAAKKAFEREQANLVAKDIIKAVSHRADNHDEPFGSIERQRRRKSIGDTLWSAGFGAWRMDENSQLLDGGFGNMGAARQFLIDEERYHRHRQMTAVERRLAPVVSMLESKRDLLESLYSKHEFSYGNFRGTYTVDDFMYAYLSQFNQETRDAVAYGNFLRTREKGTVTARIETGDDGKTRLVFLTEDMGVITDDDELRRTGDERYAAFLKLAEEKIKASGLWDVMKAIEADFNNASNRERLQRAAIAFFNNPVAFVKYYLPIIRENIKGNDFLSDICDSTYNLNTGMKQYNVEKGFTVERVKNINPRHQKPVKMSLMSVWMESVKDQEYLIEYGGYIKKAHMIFGNTELADTVNRAYGTGLMDEVNSFINLVANPHAFRDGSNENINRIVRAARGRLTTAYLAYKSSTIVMQAATSAWPFLREVKKGYLLSSLLQMASQRHKLLDSIYGKSIMMKYRSSDMIMQDAMERRRNVSERAAMNRIRRFEDFGMRGIELVDRYIVGAGWYAKYMEEMQNGREAGLTSEQADARAVKAADDMVYAVQPSGDPRDLPSLFRNKNEFARAFLQFQSSLSVIFNNLFPDNIGYARTKQWGKLVGGTVAYMMAGLTLGLVADGFDDDDDAKDKFVKIVYWMLTQPIESIPLIGSELSGIIQNVLTGEQDFYGSGTTLLPVVSKLFNGTRKVFEGNVEGLFDVGESAGLLTGLPVSGAKQLYRAIAEGNPGVLLGR